MSDLGRFEHSRIVHAQLPVRAYFDHSIYLQEQDAFFKRLPQYIGHELMVPDIGSYHTLTAENDGRALIRNAHGIELISNICRHRQAIMLQGRGQTENIVCPLHRWTYNNSGELIGAPSFAQQPCLHLEKSPMQRWNGLLFENPKSGPVGADGQALSVASELAGLGCIESFDFSGYVFHSSKVHDCAYNWKTFIEVYLEDYHVAPFHPGLGQFVNCDTLNWEFGRHFSVQTVGVHRALGNPGTPVYRKWHDEVLRINGGQIPQHGAIWFTYFPNLMLEWYPNVLVVSHLVPRGPRRTTNVVEFYYPEEIALFEPEFVQAQQAAYMETCAEDDEIAIRMDTGRQRLWERGDNDAGPYQTPMEDGMRHFHEYLRSTLSYE